MKQINAALFQRFPCRRDVIALEASASDLGVDFDEQPMTITLVGLKGFEYTQVTLQLDESHIDDENVENCLEYSAPLSDTLHLIATIWED